MMASTPMDIDAPGSSTPNGNSLQISRAPGGTTSQLSDVMSTFRPTKVRLDDATCLTSFGRLTLSPSCSAAKTSRRAAPSPACSRSTSTTPASCS